MSSRYPAAWLDELRSRSDIVQIVSGYVALNKKGRKYWGLCPFHGEKTPSFSVDGEHQLYYCFGCKAGGNVFSFYMEMEHCTFNEAVEQLAERAHMALPEMEKDVDYERRRTQRERLLNANREAARFYHETLFTPQGAASLAYLRRRGLSDGVIRKFGLGASPDDWSVLSDHLLQKGYTLDELVLAGLTVRKKAENGKDRYFDMFRSRAMFPIIDAHGNVLAFGGRTLEKREPKYLNTADTPVFNKRKGVFAANLLRQQRHLERVILVEGYMDVVSLTQFGVEGVCATLGTALTNEQARLLKRYAPQVYLGYDGDSAGQHAILRGLDILEQENVPARVLDFPDGLDPDEFIRRDGIEGFRQLPAISPATYRLRRLKDQFDLSSPDSRLAYARGAAEIVSAVDKLAASPPAAVPPRRFHVAAMRLRGKAVLCLPLGRLPAPKAKAALWLSASALPPRGRLTFGPLSEGRRKTKHRFVLRSRSRRRRGRCHEVTGGVRAAQQTAATTQTPQAQ